MVRLLKILHPSRKHNEKKLVRGINFMKNLFGLLLVISLSACTLNMNGNDVNLNANSTPTSTATAADQVATPTITPTSGVVLTGAELTMATDTAGAAIYYTMDGTTPDDTCLAYDELAKPQVIGNVTVQAIAYKDGMTASVVATEIYALIGTIADLTITPASGSYLTGQALEIASATEGISIYYTLDGTDPTEASTLYDPLAPPTITSAITVKAIAYKDNMDPSEIVTEQYAIRLAPGVIDSDYGNVWKVYGGKRAGVAGIVTWFFYQDDIGRASVMQPDGKLIVVGTYRAWNYYGFVTRYDTTGIMDSTFGSWFDYADPDSGWVGLTPVVFSTRTDMYAVALQPVNNKIVVAGSTTSATTTDFAVARLNTDGSLDTTFNGTGKVTTSMSTSTDTAYAVAVQTDGKIIAAGSAKTGGGTTDAALVRYNENGSLDETFGTGGKVITDINASDDAIKAIVLQTDGKIVAVGYAKNGAVYDFLLMRYTTAGVLDTGFNSNGKITRAGEGSSWYECNAVALQSDGKIVAAVFPASTDFAIARYNTDGSLDAAFGTAGIANSNESPRQDTATSIVISPYGDGRIFVGGFSGDTTPWRFGIVAYDTHGVKDTAFGTNGKVLTNPGPNNSVNSYTALNSLTIYNGKIYAAGYFWDGNVDVGVVPYWGPTDWPIEP